MIVEQWNNNYVVANPEKKELNELKLKEFIGRLTRQEEKRLEELKKSYE